MNKRGGRAVFAAVLVTAFAVSGALSIKSIAESRQSMNDYGEAVAVAGFDEEGSFQEMLIPKECVDDSSVPVTADVGAVTRDEPERADTETVAEAVSGVGSSFYEDLKNDVIAQRLAETDLDALKEESTGVRGWICIPDTKIDYPLMQGDDNRFYLEHTWKGEANAAGSIFLESACSEDLSDFNTIIYGHRMRNTTMFGALSGYRSQDFYEDHPSIYICADGYVRKYDVFAAFEPAVTDCTYWVQYTDDGYKQRVIDFALENTVIQCGIVPDKDSSIITLSTCTGNGHATRWVVQAVLAGMIRA